MPGIAAAGGSPRTSGNARPARRRRPLSERLHPLPRQERPHERPAEGRPGLISGLSGLLGEDWNRFRQTLIADIDALGAYGDTAAKAYVGVDTDLAASITTLMPPPHPQGRLYMD
ncbi:MAG: hypothetical protein HOW97_07165 [Catenulispora sp.]|nr:hypothetical protein [Catenulispora sp.]